VEAVDGKLAGKRLVCRQQGTAFVKRGITARYRRISHVLWRMTAGAVLSAIAVAVAVAVFSEMC